MNEQMNCVPGVLSFDKNSLHFSTGSILLFLKTFYCIKIETQKATENKCRVIIRWGDGQTPFIHHSGREGQPQASWGGWPSHFKSLVLPFQSLLKSRFDQCSFCLMLCLLVTLSYLISPGLQFANRTHVQPRMLLYSLCCQLGHDICVEKCKFVPT